SGWESWEKAVLLNYRYYFSFRRWREKHGISFYTLAFVRYGTIDAHWDPRYKISPEEEYIDQETHRSVGLMLGVNWGFPLWPRLGLDVNMGVFEKRKDMLTVDDNYNDPRVESFWTGLGFRMSVNATYAFYRHRRPSGHSRVPAGGL